MKNLRHMLVLALVGFSVLTTGLSPAAAEGSSLQCSPVHRAEMIEFAETYIDFYNNLDTLPYTTVYAEDAVLESTAGTFSGVAEIEGIMNLVTAAIPDLHYTLEEVLVDGNKLTIRYSYSGTHLGDFMGIPASGNPIKVYGLEIDEIEDGRIVRTKNFTDFFGLLVQMGAVSL